jgi:hypothetical protein
MAPKFSSGKVGVIGPGVPHPVPITLDVVAYAGTWVYGTDGRMYTSDGTVWKSTVEIAEDVAFGVIRVLSSSVTKTIGVGGDFATLSEAFEFYSVYTPASGQVEVYLNILSGTSISEQLDLSAINTGFIALISQDVEVDVDTTGFVADASGRAAFIKCDGGQAPKIFTRFVGTSGPDGDTYGMTLGAASWENGLGVAGLGGFIGFDYGVLAFQSNIIASNFDVDDCLHDAIQISGGSAYLFGMRARDAGDRGLVASAGAQVFLGDAASPTTFRKASGVDTPLDIVLATGATIILNNSGGSIVGGCNISKNRMQAEGLFLDFNLPMNPTGILNARSYTVATVPSASVYANSIIWVSNGNAGAACLAASNGTNWLRIVPGAAVAAS